MSGRCPLCGAESAAAFTTTDRNRRIGARTFSYRRCLACKSYFLCDPPDDLGPYYPEDYYGAPTLDQLDQAAEGERPKLELLRRYVKGDRLAEVGPARGVFVRAAQRAGFEVSAIEMDAAACEYLNDVLGVRAVCSAQPQDTLAQLGAQDAVVMWHVIEHLPHPWETLAAAAEALEPGGVVAFATPNPQSLQFRLLGARWAHVDAPRHLFLISLSAARARMEQLGFELAEVTAADPQGRYWNTFGWEYAIRRSPARRPSTPTTRSLARALGRALRPLEGRGMNGTAYTAVFVKR